MASDATAHDPARGARWITWTQIALVFVGLCYVVLGLVFLPLFPVLIAADGGDAPPAAFTLALSIIMLLVCLGFGAGNFVVAWGLSRRAKWAWILALVLGGIYAPSGCLPFGVLVLYGMLNGDTRALFD